MCPPICSWGTKSSQKSFKAYAFNAGCELVVRLFLQNVFEMKDDLFSCKIKFMHGLKPVLYQMSARFPNLQSLIGVAAYIPTLKWDKESEDGKMDVVLRTGEKGALLADLSSSWKS